MYSDTNPYFVFIYPKEEDTASVVIANGVPTYQKNATDLPLVSMIWNPIAFNHLTITSEMMAAYRIFIGYIE